MKEFTSKRQKIGELGESLAVRWLQRQGYTILERNFTCKTGELDIVCVTDCVTHFIEVKSICLRSTSETTYNPAENITRKKIVKLLSAIHLYSSLHSVSPNWKLDVVCVYIDIQHKTARIEYFSNILSYILSD